MSQKPHKGAGRKAEDSGNVVQVDLGEKHHQKVARMIDEKLAAAGVAVRTGMAGKSPSSPAKAGTSTAKPATANMLSGYRPGMFGHRPWYSRFGRPWMGQETAVVQSEGRKTFIIPESVRTVKTGELLTGGGLGLIGNRALVRLTPLLWKNNSKVLHEGLAFVAGAIPLLFKRNATTLGVAIPGAVFLGGTLIDMLFDWVKMPKPTLSGGEGSPAVGQDATWAARQKLANIQNRINQPQQAPRPLPRVVAQPQYA